MSTTPRQHRPLAIAEHGARIKFTVERPIRMPTEWCAEIRRGCGTVCFRCPIVADGCDAWVDMGGVTDELCPDVYSLVLVDECDRECGVVHFSTMHPPTRVVETSVPDKAPKLPTRPEKIAGVFDEWTLAEIKTTVAAMKGDTTLCVTGTPTGASPLPVSIDMALWDGFKHHPVTVVGVGSNIVTLECPLAEGPIMPGACLQFRWSAANVAAALPPTEEASE